jgi:4-hydroxy-tetrahydrodipicolinate reductase
MMRITVVGAAGRMGQALIATIAANPNTRLAGALERPNAAVLGRDAGSLAGLEPLGVIVTSDQDAAFRDADAIVDFTTPAATLAFAALAAQRGMVHIIGTTGCSAVDEAAIAEAAKRTAIVKAGNMSLGVNLLTVLTRKVAQALDADFDIEIIEMHHKHKVDAPSGTALMLGQAAAQGRGIDLDSAAVRSRDGHTGARPPGAIGFATLRGGDVVGEHTVMFAAAGERIELSHRATDRTIFARGAVKAALWAKGKPPGLYSMIDVLGLA